MIEPAIAQDPDAKRWQRARTAVHAWRGETIDLFAQAEAEINRTLLAIGCASNDTMLGARKARLARAVAVDGPYAAQGANVRGELNRFSEHDPLRCALCHGQSQVLMDQQHQWVLVLRVSRLVSDGIDQSVQLIGEAEAATLRETLRDRVARLGGQLRHLRRQALTPVATPAAALEG